MLSGPLPCFYLVWQSLPFNIFIHCNYWYFNAYILCHVICFLFVTFVLCFLFSLFSFESIQYFLYFIFLSITLLVIHAFALTVSLVAILKVMSINHFIYLFPISTRTLQHINFIPLLSPVLLLCILYLHIFKIPQGIIFILYNYLFRFTHIVL